MNRTVVRRPRIMREGELLLRRLGNEFERQRYFEQHPSEKPIEPLRKNERNPHSF